MDYIAFVHKDPKSDYGVSFPDFPGCITAGKTLNEAHKNAVDALTLQIEGMSEDGETIPKLPSCTGKLEKQSIRSWARCCSTGQHSFG